MVWFKVDDGFHCHPKTMVAGTAAIGLWTRCGSWSAQHLQNGRVPFAIARQYGTRRMIADLVTSGLWHEVEDGYQFKDWEDRNPLREQVEQVRETKRRAGQIGGVASGKTRAKPKQSPSKSEAPCFDSGSELPNPRPVPSRPTTQTPTESAAPTLTQRSKRITDAYAEQVPLSNWPAVNGVVLKALKSERYADDEIGCALLRLATDGRAVTVDVLRTELEGFGQRASPNRTTERLNQGLAVVRKLEAQARGELA